MDPRRWDQVQAVLSEVRAVAPDDRARVLTEHCRSDDELRKEVESLLAAAEVATQYFEGLQDRAAAELEGSGPREWLVPGQVVRGFRVLEKVGSGGMGDVYRATDERLLRDVALKVLPNSLADDPVQADRFRREARLLAALNHPSIAAIHGLEEFEGRAVLVLELVRGPTLAERIEEGALPVALALDVAVQIAAALQAAHDAGIVHRDLKPGNVKFTMSGRVKVLDFGIAKVLPFPDAQVPSAPSLSSPITRTGDATQVLGTLPYMSPEQLSGREVQESCDLWALGVVLFEMLVGARPFPGGSAAVTIRQILERDPDWRLLPTSVPATLASTIRRCLHKDPALRYQAAGEVRALLDDARSRLDSGGATTPARPTGSDERQMGQTFDSQEPPALQQDIRFATASDEVRIAYATVGRGPTLVKAANWLNHLEYDWDSPVWRHVFRTLASRYYLIRYDERGNGLSDWDVEDISFDAFVRDLETVVDEAAPDRFALLGISQGCAVSIAYTVAHPERVSHLVLYGGYALGSGRRGSPSEQEAAQALATLMRHGWGQDNPAFRQLFTSRMMPGANREQMNWFNDLQKITASPETAYRLRLVMNGIDIRHLLPEVSVPTLVVHARGDATVPFEQGRLLAREIPGARFCPLEGENHLLLETEPAWPRFVEEVTRFVAG